MEIRELKANLQKSQSKLKEMEESQRKKQEDHARQMEEMKTNDQTNGAITQRRPVELGMN